jgi:hypothetical protein
VDDYIRQGRDRKEVDFSIDDKILQVGCVALSLYVWKEARLVCPVGLLCQQCCTPTPGSNWWGNLALTLQCCKGMAAACTRMSQLYVHTACMHAPCACLLAVLVLFSYWDLLSYLFAGTWQGLVKTLLSPPWMMR